MKKNKRLVMDNRFFIISLIVIGLIALLGSWFINIFAIGLIYRRGVK